MTRYQVYESQPRGCRRKFEGLCAATIVSLDCVLDIELFVLIGQRDPLRDTLIELAFESSGEEGRQR